VASVLTRFDAGSSTGSGAPSTTALQFLLLCHRVTGPLLLAAGIFEDVVGLDNRSILGRQRELGAGVDGKLKRATNSGAELCVAGLSILGEAGWYGRPWRTGLYSNCNIQEKDTIYSGGLRKVKHRRCFSTISSEGVRINMLAGKARLRITNIYTTWYGIPDVHTRRQYN
jgi:hypothetical protein